MAALAPYLPTSANIAVDPLPRGDPLLPQSGIRPRGDPRCLPLKLAPAVQSPDWQRSVLDRCQNRAIGLGDMSAVTESAPLCQLVDISEDQIETGFGLP